MDERDLEAEEAWTRDLVDQRHVVGLEPLELGGDVGDLEGDVVHPRAALGQEPPDRSVLAGRFEQLYPPLADPHRGRTHALLVDRGLVLDLGAEEPCVGRERLVEVVDGNAEMVDAAGLHGGEATAPAEPPDLPNDKSRNFMKEGLPRRQTPYVL